MSWIDELPEDLLAKIPDDLKANPSVQKYETFDKFVEGFVNADSRLGNSIRIPGPDAGEGDKKEFTRKLLERVPDVMLKPDFSQTEQAEDFWLTAGKPKEETGYDIPEDSPISEEVAKGLRTMAFNANMTKAQWKAFVDQFATGESERVQQMTRQQQQAVDALKNEWGMAYPDRVEAARSVFDEFYPGEDFNSISPKQMKSLYNIHVATTGKGAQAATQPGGEKPVMTPQEALDQAAEIMHRIHDPKENLSREEKLRLTQKRIDLLQKYVPKFARTG